MTSFLISHPSFLAHDTGDYHPERPDRLRAVNTDVEALGVEPRRMEDVLADS